MSQKPEVSSRGAELQLWEAKRTRATSNWKITPIIRVVGCVSNKLACQSLIQLSVNSCKWEQIMILPVSLILTNTVRICGKTTSSKLCSQLLTLIINRLSPLPRRLCFHLHLVWLVGWLVLLQDDTKITADSLENWTEDGSLPRPR